MNPVFSGPFGGTGNDKVNRNLIQIDLHIFKTRNLEDQYHNIIRPGKSKAR